jgi:hypothetical protein
MYNIFGLKKITIVKVLKKDEWKEIFICIIWMKRILSCFKKIPKTLVDHLHVILVHVIIHMQDNKR